VVDRPLGSSIVSKEKHDLEIEIITLYNLYLTINKRMFIPRVTVLD
jgi:hypothetical protein